MRKNKQGVSLIVLSITILVMAILAATVIISLEDSGIIGQSKSTVKNTNYTDEYTRFVVIKNGILTDNLGKITLDEYVFQLQSKGLIENGVITNADGSKTVATKTGFDVRLYQDGTSNIQIEFVGYTQPPILNNGSTGNGGNNSGNNTGDNSGSGNNTGDNTGNSVLQEGDRVLDGFKIAMDQFFWGESVQIEDSNKYNAENPMQPIYDSMQAFEYDKNMTWREWVNSSYNTEGYKIVQAEGMSDGYSGEAIVTSDSKSTKGYQVQISNLIIYYDDAACTQLSTNEQYTEYHGIVYTITRGLFNLDTKIEDTLNSMVVTVTPFYNKYEKCIPFFVLGYYED